MANSHNGILCGQKSNVLEVYLITQENIHTILSVWLLSQVMKRNIQDYPYFVNKKKVLYIDCREIHVNTNSDCLWRVILWVVFIFFFIIFHMF